MTDPRIVDLRAAIRSLPRRSGIIFRHYHLPCPERRALFKQVAKLAKARGHKLLLADHPMIARQWGADGAHSRSGHRSCGIRTVAVHNRREAAAAKRIGADLILVSPVYATTSHPGAKAIGPRGIGMIAETQRRRTIALGGMTAKRAKLLGALNLYGWAAIDALSLSKG
jgi:thiamine-phosphate pyrophosphorylase